MIPRVALYIYRDIIWKGVVHMERIVIERRNGLVYAFVIVVAALLVLAVAMALFMQPDSIMMVRLSLLVIVSICLLYFTYRLSLHGTVMIVIEDVGLTIKGSILLGPIPWDCVSGASVLRTTTEKHMDVYISDVPELIGLFGEENVRKKVLIDKETGKGDILLSLDFCKLKGIDLAALINERAKGRSD